ncbi:MAG: phosphatase [Firmicutes bacterium HGW-Firmicutes-7]|nr:MAG: phosphatase [Firmicutes bacterium HGW-Firmicutes-7]
MKITDLHIHSNYSADGEWTVCDIIDMCNKQGVKTIAITDHNCVKGIDEAMCYGKKFNIDVIPGIEIDCTYKDINLHLLGYHIDYTLNEFNALEKDIYIQEKDAALKKIAYLEKIGIGVDVEEVLKKANGKIVTGELLGEIILNKENSFENELLRPYLKGGYRSDMPYLNFYRDFFSLGKAAYVPIQYLQLKDAIELVKKSGGIPVIAHPGDNLKNNMDLIDEIIGEGVEGIEVYSNYHTADQIMFLNEKAKKNDLLITGGSDFHGKNKPGIQIGCYNGVGNVIAVEKQLTS